MVWVLPLEPVAATTASCMQLDAATSGEQIHTALLSDAGHICEYILAMSANWTLLWSPPVAVTLTAAGAFRKPCGSPTPVPVVREPMNATSSNQAMASGKKMLNQVSSGVTRVLQQLVRDGGVGGQLLGLEHDPGEARRRRRKAAPSSVQ